MYIYMLPYGTEYGFKPRYTKDMAEAIEWTKRGLEVVVLVSSVQEIE